VCCHKPYFLLLDFLHFLGEEAQSKQSSLLHSSSGEQSNLTKSVLMEASPSSSRRVLKPLGAMVYYMEVFTLFISMESMEAGRVRVLL
jgi:hypothetical protein